MPRLLPALKDRDSAAHEFVEARALIRLSRLPNWPVIAEQRRVEILRSTDRRGYEAHVQLTETRALRHEVQELREITGRLETQLGEARG